MKLTLKPLLLAAVLGLASGGFAVAQPTPHHPTPQQAPPASHAGMPGMGQGMDMSRMDMSRMDMAGMHCMGLPGARLDALKRELGITPRQLRAWNAFAAAQRGHAMPDGMRMDMSAGMDMSRPGGMTMTHSPLPQRLAGMERMMRGHLRDLQGLRVAVTRLYAVLSPAQRAKADHKLCSGMMMH